MLENITYCKYCGDIIKFGYCCKKCWDDFES